MAHSKKENKDGTTKIRYKCMPCQTTRMQVYKIRKEMGLVEPLKMSTSAKAHKTEHFDFYEASRESVKRLSSRPFHSH